MSSFDFVVGIGGIGRGLGLRLVGDGTLGREESRAVTRASGRDFCKLHIVFHYLQELVGDRLPVVPIGRVGADGSGDELRADLGQTGISTRFVTTSATRPTMLSISFAYPGGDGGNLTTVDSASSELALEHVRAARAVLPGRGIAVALPEVPLDARVALLAEFADSLRIATFTSTEATDPLVREIVARADVLVLNRDEAGAFVDMDPDADPERLLEAVRARADVPAGARVVITAGARGSSSWDGARTRHVAHPATAVVNTAGAGDAYLAGLVAATILGADFGAANDAGSLAGSLSVGSPDAIDRSLTALRLAAALRAAGADETAALFGAS